MKKIIALMLAVLMAAVSFAACSKEPESIIKRGEMKDGAYINETVGITFTKPDGWRYYTVEEISALMNYTTDMVKDEDLINSDKVASSMEFMAVEPSTGNNVNFTIENLKVMQSLFVSEEEYSEILKDNLRKQLSSGSYTFGEDTRVKLGDVEFLRLNATCSYAGVTMKQYLYIKKVGAHMVCITATATDTSTEAAAFENMFS